MDDGRSWSKAPASLPAGVIGIGASDAQNATVTIQKDTCANGKSGCTSEQFLETTSDAWHVVDTAVTVAQRARPGDHEEWSQID